MIFRQLFDPETATYTYLLADADSQQALLIDPVLEQFDRDRLLLEELGLQLCFTLETHVHADHVTSAARCRELLGSKVVFSSTAQVAGADLALENAASLSVGNVTVQALHTPGHTDGCVTYLCEQAGMAFTGDALLIRGCGRTDFQQGSAKELFNSVRNTIFGIGDATRLYPGHDYQGRTVTTVAEEKQFNRRLRESIGLAEFVEIMEALNLPYPKRIDVAVSANLLCGVVTESASTADTAVGDALKQVGREDAGFLFGSGI